MYSSSGDKGRFNNERSFRHYLQHYSEPEEIQSFNCANEFIGKSAVVKYHQLLSKSYKNNGKSRFDEVATPSFSTTHFP